LDSEGQRGQRPVPLRASRRDARTAVGQGAVEEWRATDTFKKQKIVINVLVSVQLQC